MGLIRKHHELQLDILDSLARSQKALARIIESLADISATSGETARRVQVNIEAITRYQESLMVKLCGIRPNRVRTSPPSKPWINRAMHVVGSADCSVPKTSG